MKLLVADNDKKICKTLKRTLERHKFTVDTAFDGDEADALIGHVPYDVIIMDSNMPGKNVNELIEAMRERDNFIPVIVIGAETDVEEKVKTLEIGADDFLIKPFAVSELVARIKVILRRGRAYTRSELVLGNLHLDCSGYVLYTDKASFNMNNKEFQIIEHFMKNPGKAFSTEDIMLKFWGWETDSAINVVWTNIANIRRKLKVLEANVRLSSVRGVGYKLVEV